MHSDSVVNDGSDLTWTGHSTLFFGNVLTGYDMDIFESNVRVLVNPLIDTTIFHFISAQITWTGVPVPGLVLITNSAVDPRIIDSENNFNIQTENQITV